MLGGRKNPKISSRKDAKHVLTSKGPHFIDSTPSAKLGVNSGRKSLTIYYETKKSLPPCRHAGWVLVAEGRKGPGAVTFRNPYAAAARYVLSRRATEKDVVKLGNQIAADLVKISEQPRSDQTQ